MLYEVITIRIPCGVARGTCCFIQQSVGSRKTSSPLPLRPCKKGAKPPFITTVDRYVGQLVQLPSREARLGLSQRPDDLIRCHAALGHSYNFV